MFHTMSISCIISGNFRHIKNSIGSRAQAAGGNFGKIKSIKRCGFRPIAMAAGGSQSQKNQGSNTTNTNKPTDFNLKVAIDDDKRRSSNGTSVSEWKTIQHLTPDCKKFDWPAVVIVFDIETTGFSHEERIIEVAFRDLVGGTNSTFQTLVNPEKVVYNAHVHGIRTGMVTKPGIPRMKDLIPIMLKFVESRKMAGKPVVFIAHNGRKFDVPFFIREFRRCSFEVPSDWLFVDTLPLARKLVKPDGSKLASVSLKALQQHYDIRLAGPSHRAMQDVIVLSMILQKLSFELKLSVADLVEYAFKASDITTNHQPPPPHRSTASSSRKSSSS